MSNKFYTVDHNSVFFKEIDANPYAPLPRGSIKPPPPTFGSEVAQLQGFDWAVLPEYPKPVTEVELPATREELVAAITVTTSSGKVFDGDETSQRRMASAITAMEDTDTILWVLANNTVAQVAKAELKEALKLAGAAMAEIWVQPYLTEQPQ